MVIRFGASQGARRYLATADAQLNGALTRLASGQRINRAADDAAGLSIAMSLDTNRRVLTQGVRNVNDGLSMLAIADGALEQLTEVTIRLQQLAQQAANGSFSRTQRLALNEEAQKLATEFSRISRSTSFNGLSLLDGSLGAARIQAGYGDDGGVVAKIGGAIGTGRLEALQDSSLALNVLRVELGDVDGDGHADAVAVHHGGMLQVHSGRSDGTFSDGLSYSSSMSDIHLADVNGDGARDIIGFNATTGVVSYRLNKGDGTFGDEVVKNDMGSFDRAVFGDLNGDGREDFVVQDALGSTRVHLATEGGGFSEVFSMTTSPSAILLADVNSDGVMDLVMRGSTVQVHFGNGDGSFGAAISSAISSAFGAVAPAFVADVTGDGIPDAIAGAGTEIRVSEGLGDGRFSSSFVSSPAGGRPGLIQLADVNGDGLLDVISANKSNLSVLFGTGTAQFSDPVVSGTLSSVGDMKLLDADRDGVVDVLIFDVTNGNLRVFRSVTQDGVAPLPTIDLSSRLGALDALSTLRTKQDQLSTQRGVIGAAQSRLSSTLRTLGQSSEEFATARGRIVNTDIAVESAKMVRAQILRESASAVMAQANQQPELVLRLLKP